MPRQAITSSCYQHSRHIFPDESCSLSNHHPGCQLHWVAWRDAKWLSLFLLLFTPASSGAIKDPAPWHGGRHIMWRTAQWPDRECKLWHRLRCKYLWFVTWAACKHKHSHQGRASSSSSVWVLSPWGPAPACARRGDSGEISSRNGILCHTALPCKN